MNKEFTIREKIMADNFLNFYAKQPFRNDKRKALIITDSAQTSTLTPKIGKKR